MPVRSTAVEDLDVHPWRCVCRSSTGCWRRSGRSPAGILQDHEGFARTLFIRSVRVGVAVDHLAYVSVHGRDADAEPGGEPRVGVPAPQVGEDEQGLTADRKPSPPGPDLSLPGTQPCGLEVPRAAGHRPPHQAATPIASHDPDQTARRLPRWPALRPCQHSALHGNYGTSMLPTAIAPAPGVHARSPRSGALAGHGCTGAEGADGLPCSRGLCAASGGTAPVTPTPLRRAQ